MLERPPAWTDESSPTFEAFYSKEYDAVLAFAYALSGSRTGAEDLAHDAFFAAYRNWDRIGGYDLPGAWVRRVVLNLSVSAFRRRVAEAKALARAAFGERTALPDIEIGDPEFWGAVRTLPRRQPQARRPCHRRRRRPPPAPQTTGRFSPVLTGSRAPVRAARRGACAAVATGLSPISRRMAM